MVDDFETCYRFMRSRDPRYDGYFFVGVVSTGIYCRPSCPARLPKRRNVRLFRSAAAAQEAGLRACKRCDPDAAPRSPAWNRRADVAGRAFRLIAEGSVDRDGVPGLAGRLGYSERQLQRILSAEVGAGPVALARAQRAQAARLLIESTEISFGEVALASGFGSVRQFNDTIRSVYARSPTELRSRARRRAGDVAPGTIALRLACRQPFDPEFPIRFLGARAVPGTEELDGIVYRRSLSLQHGGAIVELTPERSAILCRLRLDDLRDLTAAVARCRRLLDLDADPQTVLEQLGGDRCLGDLVRRRPGLRVPACVDGFELAVRAIVGQQVSVAAGRTLTARLVERYGQPLGEAVGNVTHRFPTSSALAQADLATMPMPRKRAEALRELAGLVAEGDEAWGWRRSQSGACGPALGARGRPVDRLLCRDAGAWRPRCLPARRRGIAARPGTAGAASRSQRRAAARRSLAALALLRGYAPVAEPRGPARR